MDFSAKDYFYFWYLNAKYICTFTKVQFGMQDF